MRCVRPFSGTSALAVVIRRPGTRRTFGIGRNCFWSTPTGTMCSVSGSTRIWATMSFFEFWDTVMCRGSSPRHLHLHAQEAVPPPQSELADGGARGRDVEITVDRDRVVQGVHERPAVAHEPEQPPAEALVVVDEVELVAAVAQMRVDAAAERVRLGEAGARHDPELLDVGAAAELVRPRDPEGVLPLVEVEALDVLQGHRRVGEGPRRAGEHGDGVTELGELAGQMPAVDTLSAAVRVSPVDEKCDAEGVSGRGRARTRKGRSGGRHVEPRMEGERPERQAAQ